MTDAECAKMHEHRWHRTGLLIAPQLWRVHCLCGMVGQKREYTTVVFMVHAPEIMPCCPDCVGIKKLTSSAAIIAMDDPGEPEHDDNDVVMGTDFFETYFGPNSTVVLYKKTFLERPN